MNSMNIQKKVWYMLVDIKRIQNIMNDVSVPEQSKYITVTKDNGLPRYMDE